MGVIRKGEVQKIVFRNGMNKCEQKVRKCMT